MLSVLLVGSVPAPVLSMQGTVADAFLVARGTAREVWLTTSSKEGRKIVRVSASGQTLGPGPSVPRGAVFVDACPDGRVVFADAQGIVDDAGARLLEGRGLFTVPDPTALVVAELCGKTGQGKDELRFPVVDGLAVKAPAAAQVLLPLAHAARAYSGRVHRGLRPERGYAEALSLYGPRLFDADADGDGDTDLVAVHEGALSAWMRAQGTLVPGERVERDLTALVGAPEEADLRVRLVDLEGDARIEAVVGVTRGPVPENSEVWVLSTEDKSRVLATPRPLWKRDGFVAPIGNRGRALVVAELDTSLVSLSAVVLTGRIPVKVRVGDHEPTALQAKVDVRAAKMDGALPVIQVDFDKDGVEDLLELGEPGRAALHLGNATGFALEPVLVWDVPPFVHVVPMAELPGVVLVGETRRGKTPVAILTRGTAR